MNNPLLHTEKFCAAGLPALDLTVTDGEILHILGATTLRTELLRCLGGIDRPVSGQLFLMNQDMSKITEDEWRSLRLSVGYVSDNASLLSVIGGLRNITLPAIYHNTMAAEKIEQQALELLALSQADFNLNILPHEMSHMQQIVTAIIRAAILKPKLLFLDSPFRRLEGEDITQLMNLICELQKKLSCSMVIAHSYPRFAQRMNGKVMFVAENELVQFNTWQGLAYSTDAAVHQWRDSVLADARVFEV